MEREVRLKWEKLDQKTIHLHHVYYSLELSTHIYTHTHPFWRCSIALRIDIKILNTAYRAMPASPGRLTSHLPSPALSALATLASVLSK